MKSAFQLIVKRTGKAIGDFRMIRGGDKVAIGISGGKDSLTLFLAMQVLQRRAKEKYEIVPVFLSVDNQPPAEELFDFFRKAGTELTWFTSNIYASVKKMNEERPGESPCRLCSRFRRAVLYERIKSIGCNKLALGHHMDDMVETYLLNLFFAGKISGMPPAAKSLNHNILLIRPMAYIREKLILEFIQNTNIKLPKDKACALLPDGISTRTRIRDWLTELRRYDERIMDNAFAALKKANFFCPTALPAIRK
ncbi:MAG: hypothetical protein GXO69_10025 [Acidobacteria bacterium]|nr:hypothetical protein [Acidobacteriota bacterium]